MLRLVTMMFFFLYLFLKKRFSSDILKTNQFPSIAALITIK